MPCIRADDVSKGSEIYFELEIRKGRAQCSSSVNVDRDKDADFNEEFFLVVRAMRGVSRGTEFLTSSSC